MKTRLISAAILILLCGCNHKRVTEGIGPNADFAGTYKAGGTTLILQQDASGGLTGEWRDSESFGFSGQVQGSNFSGYAVSSTCADSIVINAVQESERSFFLTQVSGCGRKPLESSFFKKD